MIRIRIDPDPLVRGMDLRTRIRIQIKMSWIRNTDKKMVLFYLMSDLIAPDLSVVTTVTSS